MNVACVIVSCPARVHQWVGSGNKTTCVTSVDTFNNDQEVIKSGGNDGVKILLQRNLLPRASLIF